jgi:glutamate-ammonia-ligase adenylyltransferase
VAAASIGAALTAAVGQVERESGAPLPTRIAVIGMGRFGGHEMGYGSDADVMFVHDPRPGADETAAGRAAHTVVQEMRRLLTLPGPDPALTVDADLRPEGRQGPLVRSPPTWPITAAGPGHGSRRPCCGPSRWPATLTSGPSSPP